MNEHFLIGIASIIVAGIGAQWLAWRLKLPSIILLLGLGFLAGPITGLIRPDEVLGPLLFPLVSISVAIILFEGGMGLRLHDLRQIGTVVFGLVSVGALISWILIAFAARYILDLNSSIATLLGAVLIVTGPTVIIPLLRHVRPSGRVGNILKWEGIVIDPIGAALAVLVFEYILLGQALTPVAILFFLKSILIGGILGWAGAWIILTLLRKYWIPDYLHGTTTLMMVIIIFILSNVIHRESGLFAVIAMGIVLANQRKVEIQHIVSFKENLGILIISTLFIILGARLDFRDFHILRWNYLLFILVLVLFIRPLSVFVSTVKSGLDIKERLFIAWMAPRGIVAAAIVSIFSFELSARGVPQSEYLVPVTFLVIISTVLIYGSSALLVARKLGLARTFPQGILIMGAHRWARLLAHKLRDEKIKVVLVDSNAMNAALAQEEGLQACEENILDPDIEEKIDLDGIGRFIALTPNDEANSLATLHFREIFGRPGIYQLAPGKKINDRALTMPPSLRGRYLFDPEMNYDFLATHLLRPENLKTAVIGDEAKEEKFWTRYDPNARPLFLINERQELKLFTGDEKPAAKKGDKLIFLVAS
ncbi:MAG TPA: hypothetical protein DD723_00765 [Candidatus Omnitrophica bacterium]|nr:hypothetical protein [Candidatus Omnitrophota bacterium]